MTLDEAIAKLQDLRDEFGPMLELVDEENNVVTFEYDDAPDIGSAIVVGEA